ncbi:unnamed protein product, partial [marine sediment metagenome]
AFYVPQEGDGFLRRFYHRRILKERAVPDFPEVIQIQTVTGCNARCRFCPNGKTSSELSQGKMEWDLFTTIIDEVVNYTPHRISPYLMNEPLLDKDLPGKIRYIADRKKPGTKICVNTNGSLLDEQLAEQILDSGLDRLVFSVHGITPETYENSMLGLSLKRTLGNINNFLEMQRRKGADRPLVQVTMVNTNIVRDELERCKHYWKQRGIPLNIRGLGNRTNMTVQES